MKALFRDPNVCVTTSTAEPLIRGALQRYPIRTVIICSNGAGVIRDCVNLIKNLKIGFTIYVVTAHPWSLSDLPGQLPGVNFLSAAKSWLSTPAEFTDFRSVIPNL